VAKIARLEIKNCLGISELEIKAGKVNIITGANEGGKTSILEVIEKGMRNTQRRTRFVKDGAEEAALFIQLDDTTAIDRKIKPDGKVGSKITQHGASIPRPETYLKSLFGEGFGFNPVDFMEAKDKEQTEILLARIPMRVTTDNLMDWFGEVPPVNLNQHAIYVLAYLAEKYFYDKRALANGEAKECAGEIKALFEQLPDNYDGDVWREVNIGELWAAVQDGQKVNGLREKAQAIIDGLEEKIDSIDARHDLRLKEQKELLEFKVDKARKSVETDKQAIRDKIVSIEGEITAMEDEIKRLQEGIQACKNRIILKENDLKNIDEGTVAIKIESLNNEYAIELKNIEEKRKEETAQAKTKSDNAKAYMEAKPEVEIKPLEDTAKKAEEMKGYINLYDNMRKLQNALKDKQDRATQLDEFVELARAKPAELLQTIKLPVKGMGINEHGQITIDKLPINNLSTFRKMKLALDVARATSGEWHVICVDRLESLDAINRELFYDEIAKDDYQYFITTTILEKDADGNYITELQVKAVS
jgi:energy-coupling factor transporter ATP-binding protein EcfA2